MKNIIKNLSEKDYNKLEGLRSTGISTVATRSLAHYKYQQDHEEEENRTLSFGSAFHEFVLTPETFYKNWGVLPEDYKGTTKEGKEIKAQLTAQFANILKHEELEAIKKMADRVKEHPVAGELIKTAIQREQTELTLQWQEEGQPILKARIDGIGQYKESMVAFDLKTTQSAHPDDFAKSCVNYGYGIQATHYIEGINCCLNLASEGKDFYFLHIVVEKEAPFEIACYYLDAQSLSMSNHQRKRAIQKIKIAEETNVWAGYETKELSLPAWTFK